MTSETLLHSSCACVHFLEALAPELLQTLRDGNLYTASIEVSAPWTKDNLLSHIASALRFPDYFGRNLDALEECLADLSWLDSKGCVLFLEGATVFWREQPRLAGALVEIWLSCAEGKRAEGQPFHLVFVW